MTVVQQKEHSVSIIPFEAQYAEDFYRLNIAWLEKYFYVEAIDQQVLSEPETSIIAPGGTILLARLNAGDPLVQSKEEKIIGTAALIAQPGNKLELSKMAVDEAFQGQGIGKMLATAAIEVYRQSSASQLFLESNTRLQPAINLYRKLNFKEVPHPEGHSHYDRADIYMIFEE